MSADFDIHEFAKMFDAALASDNPSVQKALRNFMMISAIVHAEEVGDERIMGPLETLVKKVADLERMVYEIHTKQMTEKSYRDYYKDYIVNNPTWVSTYPNTTSGTTEWKDGLGYGAQGISELLKDLKIK